ncbi:MAG: D-tyrosyl-tRNA(Tyr) deacylase, partial [Candidatus Brocadia sp.]
MRALVQRVSSASVTVDGTITGEIGQGLLVLVCAMQGDGEKQSEWLARKVVNLRIFKDEAGRMNRSLLDAGGAALVVSQFTL